MKRKIIIVLMILIGLMFCFLSYQCGKKEAYDSSSRYMDRVEALLDSINNWDSDFMDTVMETDIYYEYELERDKVY